MKKPNKQDPSQAEDETQVQHRLQTAAAEAQVTHAPETTGDEWVACPAVESPRNPPARRTAAAIIFSPANALMNRLDVTWKFALLELMSLVAIAVVVHSLFASLNLVISTSQRQLEGVALIKPISWTAQVMQQHRGISNGLLSGNEAMREWRIDKGIESVEALRVLEAKLPTGLASNESFRHIKADWEAIRNEGLNWTREESFSAHTDLIGDLQNFHVAAADGYGLTHTPEIGEFYLINTVIDKLPSALEHLGQLRAYGTGILARKQATELQKVEINTLIARLDDALESLRINLDKTDRYNPAAQGSISVTSKDIIDSARQIIGIVKSDIITARFATSPNNFFGAATVAINKGYAQLYDSLVPMSEALIKARIARAENMLRTSVGIALLLFLVVIYFSMGICYAIVGNIRSLARSSRAFAGGDLRERVNLGTRDEFSKVGDSFNEMADGFSTMLEARLEDEARLRATIETAMDAVVRMDAEGIIIGWNSQAEKIFGWTHEEAIGRMMSETVIPPQYREAHVQGLKRFLLSGEGAVLNSRIEITGLRRDGHEFPVELSIAPIRMAGKHEFSAFIRDITKTKESDELIWKQANFDTLTGLPNRHMFHDRMAQKIEKACHDGLKIALLSIDLDKFKEVNDTLGHGMGDSLLVEAARRISGCVYETDTVARLDGDEFSVILSGLSDVTGIERVAGNILQKLAGPFQLGNEVVYISASIGVTLYPDDAADLEGLLKNADQAMNVAKNQGRNRHSYFTPALQEAAQTRLRLINDLRGALTANQFMVYFQPIMDMATGNIHKAEALIRWQHPERGMVSPAQFIPLAEETGLIFEIGDWVFHESMRWAKRWRALHNASLQISVNKSPLQFHKDGDEHTAWLSYLRELDLPGQCIAIEITEGLLMDSNAPITGALLTLRNADIQVSIDDFGTGYSSLSYLKKFDIDYLKIDQSFVRHLAVDHNDLALCEAIIMMAHKLDIKVIAEGVETEEQYRLLDAAGCDYAQGYLFSRPVPAGEFEGLLKSGQSQLQAQRLKDSARLNPNRAVKPIMIKPIRAYPHLAHDSSRLS